MLISIVIPCYYSEKTIGRVVELCVEQFRKRPEYSCEFVLVNDGSTDGTYSEICRLAKKYPFVKGINLLRNFGQHNALMCALHYVSGDYVLGMDDDLQTHPSQMFILIDSIVSSSYDLVYGIYKKHDNGPIKNFTSWLNKVVSRVLLSRPKDIVSSNYWIMTRQIADEVKKYDSYNPYIDGVFYRVTHNIGNVPVEHHRREVGSSGYTFRKLFRLWLAYWNYSVIPLRISAVTGAVAAAIGFIGVIIIIIQKVSDPSTTIGWSSLACLITIFSGLILLSLGIIGEYIGKIILTVNHTPQYIVRETIGTEKSWNL